MTSVLTFSSRIRLSMIAGIGFVSSPLWVLRAIRRYEAAEFDVASIKPNLSGDGGARASYTMSAGRLGRHERNPSGIGRIRFWHPQRSDRRRPRLVRHANGTGMSFAKADSVTVTGDNQLGPLAAREFAGGQVQAEGSPGNKGSWRCSPLVVVKNGPETGPENCTRVQSRD